MAANPLGGSPSPVTFGIELSTRGLLLSLLSDVRTIDQFDAWADDWKVSGRLLSDDDRVEIACFGGMRKADILNGDRLRQPW